MSAALLGMPTRRPVVILAYPKIDLETDYVCFGMPFSLLTTPKPLLDEGLADVILFDGNQAEPGANYVFSALTRSYSDPWRDAGRTTRNRSPTDSSRRTRSPAGPTTTTTTPRRLGPRQIM